MADVTRLVAVYKVATANIRDVLFEGEVGNFNGLSTDLKIPLSNSYKNYDMLGFYLRQKHANGGSRPIYRELPTEMIDELRIRNLNSESLSLCWGYSNIDDYFDIISSSTDNKLTINVNFSICAKIVGIKYVSVGTLIDGNNT